MGLFSGTLCLFVGQPTLGAKVMFGQTILKVNEYFEFEFYADVHNRDYESGSLSNTVYKQILLVTTKAKWKLITGHIWEFNCQFSFFSSQSF